MNEKASKIANSSVTHLVKLGLTPLESKIYVFLLENPHSTYASLSKSLNVKQPSVHRSVSKLKNYGLIRDHGTKPVELEAIDPSISLKKWTEAKRDSEDQIVSTTINSLRSRAQDENPLRVEVVEGKNETFHRSAKLVKQAQKQITILSIGEPIPEELFVAIVSRIKQGVRVRMIAEEYHEGNKELLRNWQRNGYEVRHLADPNLDFTLVIYDDIVAMLHIRMDPQRDKRTGIFFYNPGYVRAQQLYLDELWEKAIPIDELD